MPLTVTEKIARLRARTAPQVPPEALRTVREFTERLAASGVVERAKGVGDRAPAFELADARGEPVRSRDLLARGPLVISFYRGNW